MTTDILGDSPAGSHLSVLTDLLDSVQRDEMSDLVRSGALCAFGLEPGLSHLLPQSGFSDYCTPSLTLDKAVGGEPSQPF